MAFLNNAFAYGSALWVSGSPKIFHCNISINVRVAFSFFKVSTSPSALSKVFPKVFQLFNFLSQKSLVNFRRESLTTSASAPPWFSLMFFKSPLMIRFKVTSSFSPLCALKVFSSTLFTFPSVINRPINPRFQVFQSIHSRGLT
jgi:hypothetical protein